MSENKKKLIIELEFEKDVTKWTRDWLYMTLKSLRIPSSPWGDPNKVKIEIKE